MLRSKNDISPVFTLFSCGAVLCMIFVILLIKLKWFKHRLDFRNVSEVESGNGLQRGEPILLQGVFHPRQDADVFFQDERPIALPPIRIRNTYRTDETSTENINESMNLAVVLPDTPNTTKRTMKENSAKSEIKLPKNGTPKTSNPKPKTDVLYKNHRPKKVPVPLRREKKAKETKQDVFETTKIKISNENNNQQSKKHYKSGKHFEKLKDEHSSKSKTQNAISERRPTGFIRLSPDEVEDIISPNHLSPNLRASTKMAPATDNMIKLNLNKINSSDEESQNIFDKVKAKPKPEPRKHVMPNPENEKPPGTDAWSAVTKHRMLTQEIAKHHKLKPVNRNQSLTSSENLQFQSSFLAKPKTMRDMKKSKDLHFEVGGHNEDAEA